MNRITVINITVLAAISFASSIIFDEAEAAAFTISNQATCEALGGTWTTPPDTCTLNNFTLDAGDTLTINAGITVVFTGTTTINGDITNNGTIVVADNDTFTNNGTITNNNTIEVFGNGTFINNGTISDNDEDIRVFGNGTFINNGTITTDGEDIEVFGNGTFINNGTITNNRSISVGGNGTFINNGTITNNDIIEVFGNGTFINNATIDNNADLVIEEDGTFINNGTIDNNSEDFVVQDNGTFINSGTITTDERILVIDNGTFNNRCTGTIINNGIIVIDGGTFINNFGTIINNGTIEGEIIESFEPCELALDIKPQLNTVRNGNIVKTIHAEKQVFVAALEQGNIPVIVDLTIYGEIFENINTKSIIKKQAFTVTCIKTETDAGLIDCTSNTPSQDTVPVTNCSEITLSHPQDMNTVNKGNIVKTIISQKEMFLCTLSDDTRKKVDQVIFTEIWEDLSLLPSNPVVKKTFESFRCVISLSLANLDSSIPEVESCKFSTIND